MSVADTAITACPQLRTAGRVGYRADIDGLRGIAVLAVALTHAGIRGFSGGFVGVDVFFVISGYLITRNLENAQIAGWRGLRAFYSRRMRRTLPALYLVASVTLAISVIVLLPGEFDDLARSMVATLLFVPNILFLTQAGYFDHAAVAKPLFHTWSLGVEEQFYLVAPLLPFVMRRLEPIHRKATLLCVFGLALAFCVGLRIVAPPAAFYLMPARLWEFLAGCLVAERVIPEISTRWIAETAGATALTALLAAIVLFSAETPHPGLPTLLPCLATATLIHIGNARKTLVGDLLSNRVLAGVGLISYSIYLWHWPLLVFARTAGLVLSPSQQLAAYGVVLALSAGSWYFVEMPFRAPTSWLRQHSGRILPSLAAGLLVASLTVLLGRGLPQRFAPEVAAIAAYYDYADRRQFREGSCFITSKYGDARYFDRATCLHASATRPNILLIGDSHAAHLWIGFDTVFAAANIMQATASGCKPLLEPTGKRYCNDLINEVMHEFLPRQAVDVIVLSSAWGAEDAPRLAPTIAYLQHYAKKIVVVGLIPAHAVALPTLLARSLLQHDDQLVTAQEQGFVFEVDRRFRQVVPAEHYVSLVDGLCPAGKCVLYAAPGVPLQFDTDHLTSEGSILVARYFAQTNALRLP